MGQLAVKLAFFTFADEVGRIAFHGWPVKPCSQDPMCQGFRSLVAAADSLVSFGEKLVSFLVSHALEPRSRVPPLVQVVVQD